MHRLAFALLALLAAPAAAGDAQTAYERGYAAQRAKQTDAAVAAYREALALDPELVAAWYELGWSYWVLSRWDDVVECWQRVLALQPDHADAARHLPEALSHQALAARARSGVTPPPLPPKDGRTLRLAFGGDTMLGSPQSKAGLPRDPTALLAAFSGELRAADLAFLNLEGVLADRGVSDKCEDATIACYAFRTPTAYTAALVAAGVDVVSTANNHHNDYGSAGRASTVEALGAAGIAYTGPVGVETALTVDGRTVAFIGFSTSVGQNDLRRIDAARVLVADAAAKADLVVVSFHGGAEGSDRQHVPGAVETFVGENRGDVRAFARACVEAGADLVVGHGPHVLRGMEVWQGRLIAYSLGNFITYGGFNLQGPNGLSALLVVDLHADGRLAGGRLIPARQVPPGGPVLDDSREAVAVVRALSLADFPDTAVALADDGTFPGVAP